MVKVRLSCNLKDNARFGVDLMGPAEIGMPPPAGGADDQSRQKATHTKPSLATRFFHPLCETAKIEGAEVLVPAAHFLGLHHPFRALFDLAAILLKRLLHGSPPRPSIMVPARLKKQAHPQARLVQLRLGRPHADPQQDGDLFVRVPLHIVELENSLIAGR
jgi:hypothetical protein